MRTSIRFLHELTNCNPDPPDELAVWEIMELIKTGGQPQPIVIDEAGALQDDASETIAEALRLLKRKVAICTVLDDISLPIDERFGGSFGERHAVRVRASQLTVELQRYQRKIDFDEVARLVANFNWKLFTPLIVGRRKDGTLQLIDGQHHCLAAVQKFGPDVEVPVYIIDVENEDEEALIWNACNGDENRATHYERFEARVIAGVESAKNTKKILNQQMIQIAADQGKPGPYEISSTKTVEDIYRIYGGPLLRQTLTLARGWLPHKKALSPQVLNATAKFLHSHQLHPNFDWPHVVETLAKKNKLEGILEDGRNARKSDKRATAAEVLTFAIARAYNFGQKEKRRIMQVSPLQPSSRQKQIDPPKQLEKE